MGSSRQRDTKLGTCTPDQVYQVLRTSPQGLRTQEVKKRQATYGPNQLKESKKEPIWLTFFRHFTSLMALLLWVGGCIAVISHSLELGIAIWLVNIINGLFSFIQEYRASQATEALNKLLPSYTRVLRDGKEDKILAQNLVPGDLVFIEEGDRISADGRLIAVTDLQVNQSALTGESNPIYKSDQADLAPDKTDLEYDNMVFAGTTVSSGSGHFIVSAIGMKTEFGQIADLTQNLAQEKSPLQKELDHLTKQISVIAVSVGLFFMIAATLFVHQPLSQAFIFALGMIVAFIPEGLLPTVTLSLAMAVQRMAKEHALVKKLSSVETLGATSVICSDKTGTLTQNAMTVNHLWTLSGNYEVTGLGYAPEGHIEQDGHPVSLKENDLLNRLVRFSHLASNAQVVAPSADNPNYTVLGDPTEACLNVLAEKAGLDLNDNHIWAPRIKEIPFDSDRKRMTTVHSLEKGLDGSHHISITKGAPKEVMELCSDYYDGQGAIKSMTTTERQAILAANDQFACDGLRVLAVAYRPLEGQHIKEDEWDMQCHRASIRIIMVTGDYGLTALSIAKKIGIVTGDNARVVSGLELADMTDQDLKEALKGEIVFARVAPEQKYRVVNALQELGEVVAVTGDGVNDAPALKKADIGVAMGISGTDVAKESADMILTDDHFASIVHAVEEGRAVYRNIQKFLTYIFNSNTPEAVPSAFFLFSLGRIPLPLTVMQILAIDLGTDMMPALGLGVEPPEEGVMNRPPRRLSDRLLNRQLLLKAFAWYGMIESVLAMGAFFLNYWVNQGHLNYLTSSGPLYREATTMTLGAIIFTQIGMAMNSRKGRGSIFQIKPFANRIISLGIVLEIILFILLSYVPLFHTLFNTAPIGLDDWLYLLLCPFIIMALEEIRHRLFD